MGVLVDGYTHANPPRPEMPKTTMGDPDGPEVFIPSLGREVPTYIDPRVDLITNKRTAAIFKRLSYHVPFKLRGIYKPEWLPHDYAEHMGEAGEIRTNFEGFVMCSETSKASGGDKCGNLAVNRTNVCRNHGGALHPADKKFGGGAIMTASVIANNPERVAALDRTQKFMQGLLAVEDLTDDEITGAYVLTDDGRPVSNTKLGVKFQQMMVKELHRRMNNFMQMKLPTMLKRVAEIAESDIVEPETALKAAIWTAERQMGKTPEVLIHAQTGAPYESILDRLESGSRDAYRKSVESQRVENAQLEIGTGGSGTPGVYSEDGEPLDVFEVDDGEEDPDDGEGNSRDADAAADFVRIRPGDESRTDDESGHGSGESSYSRATELEEKAAKAKRIIAERKKAQKRRYAARAQGATQLNDMWWLPIFKDRIVQRGGKKVKMGRICTLVCPDDQNERTLAKIAAQDIGGTDAT